MDRISISTAKCPSKSNPGREHFRPVFFLLTTRHIPFILLCLLLLALTPCNASVVDPRITAARVAIEPYHARVVLESDTPLHARLLAPKQPGKYVLDLGRVAASAALASIDRQPIPSNTFLQRVTLVKRNGHARLVLSAPPDTIPYLFSLQPMQGHGNRLILDIRAGSPTGIRITHAAVSAKPHVTAARIGVTPQHARLVIESDAPLHAHLLAAAQPGKVILDLDGVAINTALTAILKHPISANAFLQRISMMKQSGHVRIALHTLPGTAPHLFFLQPLQGHGNRLVLDIQAASVPSSPPPPAAVHAPPSAPPPAENPVNAATTASHQANPVSPRVTAVRIGTTPDHARVVLESNAPLHARLLKSPRPGQVLIDLDGVASSTVLTTIGRRPIPDNPFLRRIALTSKAGHTRLELSILPGTTPQMFNLRPMLGHGNRLVVDIQAAPPAPAPRNANPPPVPAKPPRPTLPAQPPVTNEPPHEAWLDVHLNGIDKGIALVLIGHDGHVLVRAQDLQQWRIDHDDLVDLVPVRHGNEDYYALDALPEAHYRIEKSSGTLDLKVPATLLRITQMQGVTRTRVKPAPSPFGAYLNYSLSMTGSDQSRFGTTGGALLDSGVFGPWGSLTASAVTRRLDGHNQTVRLDTTWIRDQPDSLSTFRIGDSISGASSWGRSVRFGGVQWATDFATQPQLITFPLPTLGSVAALPSTVDLYVNDVLRLRRHVAAGPFSIQDLPVVTGQGDIRMVVTDLLGREQVVQQPYYAGGGLLAPGLRDYSYDIGFERKNYSLRSNEYGSWMAVGTERYGFTNHFTGGLHAELLRDQQTIGAGATMLLPGGVLTAAVAGSHADKIGNGALMSLGFQHRGRGLSFGLRSQFTTNDFTQLGYTTRNRPPRQSSSAYLSIPTPGHGSLALNYTRQDYRDSSDVRLAGISYSHSLGRLGYLSLSLIRFLTGEDDTLVSMVYTVPLGDRSSASLNAQSQSDIQQGSIQLQHSLPPGPGMGYRLQAGLGPGAPRQAGISLQNDMGTYDFDVAQNQNQTSYRVQARGSVALLDDRLFFSRNIGDSFAVVQVPGISDVRVYADNHMVARTNDDGYALIPGLRPYQENRIRIDQADLPLDASIAAGGLKLKAVPYLHGALTLKFPVHRTHSALLTITVQGGAVLPAGAQVWLDGNATAFPVGLHGEVYLTDLASTNHLHVIWRDQSCDLVLNYPRTTDPLPRLGPLSCLGVKP